MRVKLVDVDSEIPNLALMKISAYHKERGNEVGFGIGDPSLRKSCPQQASSHTLRQPPCSARRDSCRRGRRY